MAQINPWTENNIICESALNFKTRATSFAGYCIRGMTFCATASSASCTALA